MYKLISSSRDSDELPKGFHRSIEARERQLTNKKLTERKYHVRIYSKVVLNFADRQDKCSYSLGYELTLRRYRNNHVLSHPARANDAENVALAGSFIIDVISLYVPRYTTNISNQKLMLRHIVPKAATELSYAIRSSFTKDVTTQNNWTFELVMGGGNDIPIKVLVGFKQGDQINQPHQNKDDF